MYKTISILLLTVCLTSICLGQKKQEKKIKKLYDAYKTAIKNNNGIEAYQYIDGTTTYYYTNILDVIKRGDYNSINKLDLLDKMTVLTIRHRLNREEIMALNAESLFVYAVNNAMVSRATTISYKVNTMKLYTNYAMVELVPVKGNQSPFNLGINKEQDEWKIDVTTIISFTGIAFNKMVKESGQRENDYLFTILEMLTDKKPGADIWEGVE